MPEESIREIQLSRKQLVFLFMASVVVAVAVFLLGVSVGRGVRGVTGGTTESSPLTPPPVSEAAPPGEMLPKTEVGSKDLAYGTALQGAATSAAQGSASASDAGKAAPPAPQNSGVVPEVDESQPGKPVAKPESTPAASMTSAAPKPEASPKAGPAPKPSEAPDASKTQAGSGWTVQVDAFHSRENADRQAAQLKAKGFAAAVAPTQSGGLFRVRVGPFPQRADAEKAAARLRQEGLKPSVTR